MAEIPEGNQRLFDKNTLSKIAAVFVYLPKGCGVQLPGLGSQEPEGHGRETGGGRDGRVWGARAVKGWGRIGVCV